MLTALHSSGREEDELLSSIICQHPSDEQHSPIYLNQSSISNQGCVRKLYNEEHHNGEIRSSRALTPEMVCRADLFSIHEKIVEEDGYIVVQQQMEACVPETTKRRLSNSVIEGTLRILESAITNLADSCVLQKINNTIPRLSRMLLLMVDNLQHRLSNILGKLSVYASSKS